MTNWTAEAVLAEAAAWVWIPPDARQATSGEYQLIAYPDHYLQPTSVAWSASGRPAADLIAEITAHVRAFGRDTVYWWVRDTTRPRDLETALRGRGGVMVETVQYLAFDLAAGEPDLGLADRGPAEGLTAEVVTDEAGLRAHHLVSDQVWDDHRVRSPQEIDAELARAHGATLALVKGRVETSVPILRRAGFTVYGEDRCYRLPADVAPTAGQPAPEDRRPG